MLPENNDITSAYSKLILTEYRCKHDRAWDLCKRLKFKYFDNWYIHKLEPVLEIDTQKSIYDFEIQTDHVVLAK